MKNLAALESAYFRGIAIALLLALPGAAGAAELTVKALRMSHNGVGYYMDLYEQAISSQRKSPAILLVPEFWGKDALAGLQARRLAQKGYTVLVIDLYGRGRHSRSADTAFSLQEEAERVDLDTQLGLFEQATETLMEHRSVDRQRIAVVGLGYGGGLAYNYAKKGKSGWKAIVSFYGGMKKLRVTSQVGHLPAFLYVRPEFDNYNSDGEFQAFASEMARSNFKFDSIEVKEAFYGFIHPNIETYGEDMGKSHMHYNAKAAEETWVKVFKFLETHLR